MIGIDSLFLRSLISKANRDKARLKYEIKLLEYKLFSLMDTSRQKSSCYDDIHDLCDLIANAYTRYLHLLGCSNHIDQVQSKELTVRESWFDTYYAVLKLRKQWISTHTLQEESTLLRTLSLLYWQISDVYEGTTPLKTPTQHLRTEFFLYSLFTSGDLQLWLLGLIDFWNKTPEARSDHVSFFAALDGQQQQYVLDFLASPECTQLINTVFFYKKHPEQLTNQIVSIEKLVSLSSRLTLLHRYLEEFHQDIHSLARQKGLEPGIDFLFHNEELPSGVCFTISDDYKALVLSAVKLVRGHPSLDNAPNSLVETRDFLACYKFCFNPNRLVDTVMLLRQCIEKANGTFAQGASLLYQQLATAECVDLYGYFSNHDTRYFLFTLSSIVNQSYPHQWLPVLGHDELSAVQRVLTTLRLFMDALRTELSYRTIITEPYVYQVPRNLFFVKKRDREAVLRILTVYCHEVVDVNTKVDLLLMELEDSFNEEDY